MHLQADEDEQELARQKPSPKLDWKDYVALTIAALESTFLPVLLIMLTLIGVAMVIVHLSRP